MLASYKAIILRYCWSHTGNWLFSNWGRLMFSFSLLPPRSPFLLNGYDRSYSPFSTHMSPGFSVGELTVSIFSPMCSLWFVWNTQNPTDMVITWVSYKGKLFWMPSRSVCRAGFLLVCNGKLENNNKNLSSETHRKGLFIISSTKLHLEQGSADVVVLMCCTRRFQFSCCQNTYCHQ